MKRIVLAGILGIASTTGLLAQGHVNVSNYLTPPYNQVLWAAWFPPGLVPMNDPSVELSIWYADGVVTDEGALTLGPTFHINPALTYNGGGYFDLQNVVIPGWTAGDVTLQLRARGYSTEFGVPFIARSVMWISSEVVDTGLPANTSAQVPQLVVGIPEPSTLALAGVGLAAILLFRQRVRAGGTATESTAASNS